jgi:RING finger/CHY zinc finger protein 1
MSSEQEKRELIKSINLDKSLSDKEKRIKIQQIMMGNFNNASYNKCLKSNFEKTCEHYNKKCYKFHFTCCNIYDPCIRCHRERRLIESENMLCNDNNIIVEQITCSECDFAQPLSNICINCSVQFATNYCDICKIYTDKNITHCEYCKICRIGNKDDLFHCFNCNGCFFSINKSSHKCQINLLDETCSVCNESIFNSRYNSHISECGHPIHEKCLQDSLTHGQYKCSLCKKSIIDMSAHWNMIRTSIANTPLPFNMFPINLDDIVDSPYGKFKILQKKSLSIVIFSYNCKKNKSL